MPIVLQKKKPVTAAPRKAEDLSDFAEIIDKAGPAYDRVTKTKARIKALTASMKDDLQVLKVLEAEIRAMAGFEDDEEGKQLGSTFIVEFGKKGTSREIKDLPKVLEYLGQDLFIANAKVALKVLDDYLTPPQLEEVLETVRGDRGYKVVKRA